MSDLRIEITEAEILADLSWPGPPPGRWSTEQRAGQGAGAGGERAAGDGGRRQQREADQDAQHRVAERGAVEQRDRLVVADGSAQYQAGEVRKPSAVAHSDTATVKPKMPTGSRTSE